MLSFHLTKAILALLSITTLVYPISSFSISFTRFSGVFSTLINQTVAVAETLFSLEGRSNRGLVSKISWYNDLILHVLAITDPSIPKSRSKKSYIPSKDKIEWHIRVKLKEPKVCIQIFQAYLSLIACIHIYQSRETMICQYLLFAQGGSWKDTVHSVYW